MPAWELSTLTWQEVAALDRSRCVAILPVGAVEAHGPHLPLGTDVLIAEAMARAGGERLSAGGLEVLLLPALPYSAAPFAAGFPGTLSVDAGAVESLVRGIAGSLGAHGLPLLALANAHLDPAHLGSLRAAAGAAPEAGAARVVFPDLVRRPLAARLTEEFRSGACHAGRYETSVVLAERPELVRRALQQGLPPIARSLPDAIRAGRRTFEEAGGESAYFGWPAEATEEEGRRTVEVLGEILEEAVLAALGEVP
jgi:creatinine amidohydrolase